MILVNLNKIEELVAKVTAVVRPDGLLKFTLYVADDAREKIPALIEKYNELGFRDATIIEDSIGTFDEKHVNVYVHVDEGDKYYLRDINWVGNTVITTDYLNAVLGMNKGDVCDQKKRNKRLNEDEDAAGN